MSGENVCDRWQAGASAIVVMAVIVLKNAEKAQSTV